jgi:hypothetical protein
MANKKIYSDYSIEGEFFVKGSSTTYQENLDVDSALVEVVATVDKTIYDAVFFDYVVKNGTNIRSGTVVSSHNGTSAAFYDNSTTDLGDTSGVNLSVDISGNDLRLKADVSTDNWQIKCIVRAI